MIELLIIVLVVFGYALRIATAVRNNQSALNVPAGEQP
jgi:hypothetical protein